MTIVVWILSALLAVIFLGAGAMKLVRSREQLLQIPQMAWANDFSPGQIRLIGVAEVAGALGLVLPWATGIARVLTPVAAAALVALMVGAILVHLRRGERQQAVLNTVLVALAVVVAVYRFAQLGS